MNKTKSIFIIIPFIIIIFSTSILNFIKKDKYDSILENRVLQQKPGINDIINGEYANLYEVYYSDQFIFREPLLKLKTMIELALKKDKVKNHYVNKEWILDKMPNVYEDNILIDMSNIINSLASYSNDLNKEFYYISTPFKSNMLMHLYPKYIEHNSIEENNNKFLSFLDKNIMNIIDLNEQFKSEFTEKELEKLYFKTDHHWNGIGAYKGFQMIINNISRLNKEIKSINDEDYIIKTINNKPFLGSYNRKLNSLLPKNENVDFVYLDDKGEYEYYMKNENGLYKVEEDSIIASKIEEDEIDYAGSYINDHGYYKIVNKQSITNKKILIFRDSYQAPMSWLLADIFREVEIVDSRNKDYLNTSCKDIIKSSNADIVMTMFNSDTFASIIPTLQN